MQSPSDPYASLPEAAADPYAKLPDAGAAEAPGLVQRLKDKFHKITAPNNPTSDSRGASELGLPANATQKDIELARKISPQQNVGTEFTKGVARGAASLLWHPWDSAKAAAHQVVDVVNAVPIKNLDGTENTDARAARDRLKQQGRDMLHSFQQNPGYTAGQIAGQGIVTEGAGEIIRMPLERGGVTVPATPGGFKERLRTTGRSILVGDAPKIAVEKAADEAAASDTAVKSNNEALEEQRGRRRQAAEELQQHTQKLASETARIKSKASVENAQNWNTVREKVGKQPVSLEKVKTAIEDQAKTMDPQSQSIFRSMLKEASPQDEIARVRSEVMQNAGLVGEGAEKKLADDPQLQATIDEVVSQRAASEGIDPDSTGEVPFTRAQGWYTELGQKQFRGGQIPGNIYTAIDNVRRAVRGSIDETAEAHGALDDLNGARASNVKYQEAFGRQRNRPLSAAEQELKAANPQEYAQNRENDRRAKVAIHDKDYLTHAQNVDQALDRVKSFPSEQTINNGVKAPDDAQTVDVAKVAKEAIDTKARQWKSISRRDIGMIGSSVIAGAVAAPLAGKDIGILPVASVLGYEGVTRALAMYAQRPGVAEWFAAPPAGELEALREIPGADRVKVVSSLTKVATEAAKAGKLKRLSPAVSEFLGPANSFAVGAAIAANQKREPPKSAAEAKARVSGVQ
jgi:hypothetical protein